MTSETPPPAAPVGPPERAVISALYSSCGDAIEKVCNDLQDRTISPLSGLDRIVAIIAKHAPPPKPDTLPVQYDAKGDQRPTYMPLVPPRSTPPIEGLVVRLMSRLRVAEDNCNGAKGNPEAFTICNSYRRDIADAITQLTQLQGEVERLKFYIATTIQPEEHAKVIAELHDQLRSALALAGEGQKKTQAIGCQEATNSKVEAAQPKKETGDDMTTAKRVSLREVFRRFCWQIPANIPEAAIRTARELEDALDKLETSPATPPSARPDQQEDKG